MLDQYHMLDDVPVTQEYVDKVKSTVGSLYLVKADTIAMGEDPNPLVAYFNGDSVYKGEMVVLVEYQEQCSWTDKEEKFYTRNVLVKILTPRGYLGRVWFEFLQQM